MSGKHRLAMSASEYVAPTRMVLFAVAFAVMVSSLFAVGQAVPTASAGTRVTTTYTPVRGVVDPITGRQDFGPFWTGR